MVEEEYFDGPILCRAGKHTLTSFRGRCLDCRKERLRSARARHAASFVNHANKRLAPDWIPTEAIRPIIKSYLSIEGNTLEDLCDRMGVSCRTVLRWVDGTSKHASLDSVDRMLCAMDELQHFWTTLSEYYFAGIEQAAA